MLQEKKDYTRQIFKESFFLKENFPSLLIKSNTEESVPVSTNNSKKKIE